MKAGDEEKTAASASGDSAEEANGEETGPAAAAGRSKGKGAKEAGEAQKEGYVHVRARSGQATNSHSLAEKVPYFRHNIFLQITGLAWDLIIELLCAVKKGEDQRKDEAFAGPCSWLQQSEPSKAQEKP